jgi:hypothetical protein
MSPTLPVRPNGRSFFYVLDMDRAAVPNRGIHSQRRWLQRRCHNRKWYLKTTLSRDVFFDF